MSEIKINVNNLKEDMAETFIEIAYVTAFGRKPRQDEIENTIKILNEVKE